jgi:hypothetical protein
MLQIYAKKLRKDLSWNEELPLEIDLILTGGAFNGSYLIGALIYLKELERNNYIRVSRISGVSISSIFGLLYIMDDFTKIERLYKNIAEEWCTQQRLSKIKQLRNLLGKEIAEKYYLANDRLFISYNNITTREKKTICNYNNSDELYDAIICSCFIPFYIDNQLCYQEKYTDGITPFIFPENGRKRLFIDLFTKNKWKHMFSIEGEQTPTYRMLNGLLDIHAFFWKSKGISTMCSYVEKWQLYDYVKYNILIYLEKTMLLILYILYHVMKKCKKKGLDKKYHILYRKINEIYKIIMK